MYLAQLLLAFTGYLFGNKAKGRISKRVFQGNKARQIFQKSNVFPPDTHMWVCILRCKKCLFLGKFVVPCFLETLFLRLALSPYYCRSVVLKPCIIKGLFFDVKVVLLHLSLTRTNDQNV